MLADLVEQQTSTTGTGTYTVSGSVVGRRTFADALTDGVIVPYVVTDDLSGFECGWGTWAEGTTALARTQIIASSNGNAAVNWAAGTKRIYVSPHSGTTGLAQQRHNLTASFPPSSSNDASQGYGVGSLWYNSGAVAYSICIDPTIGAAKWSDMLHIIGADTTTPTVIVEARLRDPRTNAPLGNTGFTFNSGYNSTGGDHYGDGAITGLMAQTSDATPTKMAFDGDYGTHGGLYCGGSGCHTLTGSVSAVDNTSGDIKSWKIEVVALSDASEDITIVAGGTPAELYESAGATGWSIAVIAGAAASGEVNIEVTGEAATDITWSATLVASSAVSY